jgi:hypothetical protein
MIHFNGLFFCHVQRYFLSNRNLYPILTALAQEAHKNNKLYLIEQSPIKGGIKVGLNLMAVLFKGEAE